MMKRNGLRPVAPGDGSPLGRRRPNGRTATRAVFTLWLALAASLGHAHPEDDWLVQARVLMSWAEALSHGDTETVRRLTASGAAVYPVSADMTVIASRATFSPDPDGVIASPVVMLIDGGTLTSAAAVRLKREGDGWKVGAVTPSQDVPAEFLPHDLPEHADSRPVQFALTDATSGEPVFARVRITDAAGDYWPPEGHQKHIRTGWRQDVGGDVSLNGRSYAYVGPQFVARLPDGEFTLEARKGTEYLPASVAFTVGSDRTDQVELRLRRWIDMGARGWHAGDTHTHFLNDHTALLELRAEDLSVVYVLATKWGELITDVAAFTGAPSPVSDEDALVVVNEETRHGWLGHTILHGIESLVYPLSWGGPSEGVAGGYDYPPMAHQADLAHAQGGLVTWAHFPYPGGELPVDVALGKVDTVDLFTWSDAFAPGPAIPGGGALPSAAQTWYLFLNTGARLPATAGTDKMLNVQVMGSVRTYAYTGDTFSYRKWLDALAGGATIVTTGPIVTLTANGRPIGSEIALQPGQAVALEASVESPYELYPVDSLEIVSGGEVVATATNSGGDSRLVVSAGLEPTASTWVAARARGSKLLPMQMWPFLNDRGIPPMAHTSPIYLSVDGRPVWVEAAAQRLEAWVDQAIAWAGTQARFQSPAQRREVIALFEEAKAFYAHGPGNGQDGADSDP